MDQLGLDIATLCPIGSPLDIRQVITFGMQLVRRLEQLHSLGITHNDLKLQNIVVGTGPEENNIKLIDFGISSSYIKSPIKWCDPQTDMEHISNGSSQFEGNIAFASANCLNDRKRSRKDDLISVVYILLRLCLGELPYYGEAYTIEEYRLAKNNESPTELCTRH